MARVSTVGLEIAEEKLDRLGRDGIRKIVEAGSTAVRASMEELTREYGHVRTGELIRSIRAGKLYESYHGASQNVDFEGMHQGGITNHDLAYIIDNGHRDRFVTGNEARTEEAATRAMQAESDRILAEN